MTVDEWVQHQQRSALQWVGFRPPRPSSGLSLHRPDVPIQGDHPLATERFESAGISAGSLKKGPWRQADPVKPIGQRKIQLSP